MGSLWPDGRGQQGWLLVGLVILLFVVVMLWAFVGAVLLGLFLYYAIRPIDRWLAGYIAHPGLTATLTLLSVGIPLLAVVGYAALVAVRELGAVLVLSGIGQYRSLLQPYVDVARVTDPTTLVSVLRGNLGRFVGIAGAAFTWTIRVFVAITVGYYLLKDDERIAAWARETFGPDHTAVVFGERVDADLTTIYTGNLITIGLTGLIAAAVYQGLDFLAPAGTGVTFPILLGLVTGVATLVPTVGMKLVYVPYTGYLVVESLRRETAPLWFPALFFVVVLLVVDTVPDLFIRSYVSSGRLHMGLLLLSYVLGTVAFGWWGLFFGPIVLVLLVHFARTIFPTLVSNERPDLENQ